MNRFQGAREGGSAHSARGQPDLHRSRTHTEGSAGGLAKSGNAAIDPSGPLAQELWETEQMVNEQGANTLNSGNTRGNGTPRGRFGNRRELIGRLGVAAAIAFAGWLLISGLNDNQPTPERAGFPNGLESVSPSNLATNVPSQATIIADLAFGQTGVLVINSREIPLDQLDYERATGTLSFTPGDAQEFSKLPGSDVSAVVIFWAEQGDRATDAREFAWTFKVS